MRFRPFALLAVAVLGLAACSEDPTEAGDGDPEAIITTRTTRTEARNTSFSVTGFAVDANLKRIPGALTAVSAGAAVRVDSAKYIRELAETRVFMTALSVSAAGTIVTLSGHGLTKDVTVIVT